MTNQSLTHSDLVELAKTWLHRDHSVVITEMSSGHEEADAIGFKRYCSTLIECKASRADFLSDKKKIFRQCPELGMGCYRYFLAPKGIINKNEVPDGWGLLEINEKGRFLNTIKPSFIKDIAYREEFNLLLSALRRVGKYVPENGGCSVKFYTYETNNKSSLGVLND